MNFEQKAFIIEGKRIMVLEENSDTFLFNIITAGRRNTKIKEGLKEILRKINPLIAYQK